MNIFRRLTPVSDASMPSPTSTAEDDEAAIQDILAQEELCLQHIFTDEVYKHIYATKRSSGSPLVNSALRHIDKRNRTLGEYNSQVDLFRHYGIRTQQKRRLRSIANWILGILPFTRNTTTVDSLKTIAVLATRFLQENKDGGLGYSFGTLLERYIAHHFIHQYSFLEDIQYHLIGGNGPFCIPNRTHSEVSFKTNRANGRDDVDVSVKLHLVLGKHVASSGAGSLLGRVRSGLEVFLEKTDGIVYLCHGTSVESASSIVREGPNPYAGARNADFGSGFYLTDSWEYALLAAHQAKADSSTPMECAVLVFPVSESSLLNNCELLDLRGDQNIDRWAKVVKNGIRDLKFQDDGLFCERKNSGCIVGPTVKNFDQVHCGKEPQTSEYVQWAFHDEMLIRRVLQPIIARGDLHFFRFLHEHEDEWETHLVLGKHVASWGAGSVLGRVGSGLEVFLEKKDGIVYLCHGTSVESASSIVREGPSATAGVRSADFGRGFYLTDSWEYALLAAHQAKADSSTPMECAVLVFPVSESSLLNNCELLDLRGDQNIDRWVNVVKKGVRDLAVPDEVLDDEREKAECIVGPTVKNFAQVHASKNEPQASEYVQWVFQKQRLIRRVLQPIIARGDLHFFRFYHEHEDEWETATEESGEGNERLRRSKSGSQRGSGRRSQRGGGLWRRGSRN